MDYAILDDLYQISETNREIYETQNSVYIKSGIEKIEEPWTNSDDVDVYIYHNYVKQITGPMDLLIIIWQDDNNKTEQQNDLMVKKYKQAIFPLNCISSDDAIDIPVEIKAPNIKSDKAKFICEKRSLPKKPKNVEFDPNKHKWDVNKIAMHINMSNRLVALFCRANNL